MITQRLTHSLRIIPTAHLAQTMTLLELTGPELRQEIESALANNPALEQVDEGRCPTCHRRLPRGAACPACSRPRDSLSDQPIVFVTPSGPVSGGGSWLDEEGLAMEEWATLPEDLPTFVLRQIATELSPADRPVAAHILTSLDDDGLLRIPLLEIARYNHVLPARVEAVQRMIQRAEPVGVGSSSPQKALLVQLEVLAETQEVPPLAFRAVREGMELLSRRAYAELGSLLKISTAQSQDLARFIITNLNPYPARAHWGEGRRSADYNPPYSEPDIVLSRLNDKPNSPLVVEILSPYAGTLRINPLFREAVLQAPPEKTEQWHADLESAQLLVKCLQQRDNTLVRLMQRIAVLQRGFILSGDEFLAPVTRASLAIELDVHESTISRAVSEKTVQLPNKRIVPLAKFFDRSLHVRTALRNIVAQEEKPMSDTEIAKELIAQGYPVARRTVAKYRAMEGILPARLRNDRPACQMA